MCSDLQSSHSWMGLRVNKATVKDLVFTTSTLMMQTGQEPQSNLHISSLKLSNKMGLICPKVMYLKGQRFSLPTVQLICHPPRFHLNQRLSGRNSHTSQISSENSTTMGLSHKDSSGGYHLQLTRLKVAGMLMGRGPAYGIYSPRHLAVFLIIKMVMWLVTVITDLKKTFTCFVL